MTERERMIDALRKLSETCQRGTEATRALAAIIRELGETQSFPR